MSLAFSCALQDKKVKENIADKNKSCFIKINFDKNRKVKCYIVLTN
jgi:transcription antitermination factor NusG